MAHQDALDDIDRRLLIALADNPRAGVLALARSCRIARNTAQAHFDKLLREGVIVGFGPDLDLRKLGYGVSAFVSLEISQRSGVPVDEHLAAIPEIVEAWMTTGTSDLICRVVARDNDHLGQVIGEILQAPGVTRTTTSLLLTTRIPPRRLHLVTDAAPGGADELEPDPVILEQQHRL